MSFKESAQEFALEKALAFEEQALRVGIVRSVDATEASDWLWSIADAIREACGDSPAPRGRKRR